MTRPTFLMAEPEPEQALSARKLVLETAKFNVITAHSAREATELCQRFPSIDALIVHGMLQGDCANVVAEYKRSHTKTGYSAGTLRVYDVRWSGSHGIQSQSRGAVGATP